MKLPAHKGKFAVLAVYIIVVFLAPIFSAVTYNPEKAIGMFAKFVAEKDDQFFRSYIALLKDQKVDEAYALLSPEAQQASSRDELATVAKEFTNMTDEMTIVGVNINHIDDESPRTIYQMSYEVVNNDPEKKYVGVNISARDQGQGIKIDGVQTFYGATSLKEGAKFNFPKPYWMLLIAVLIPLFVAYTAYRYITKAANPKWWLFLVILLISVYVTIRADGGFSVNFGFNGFMGPAGIWGPWVYFTSVPLGAIFYYFMRKRVESPNVVQGARAANP